MRLDRVEVRKLALRLKTPFETSVGRITTKEFLLVSVYDAGMSGHGECVADVDAFYLPETNATVYPILRDFLVPMVFALDLRHPREVRPALARVRGHEMAKASLEMAVWDLMAHVEGRPLYDMLGGGGGPVEAGVSVGLQDDDARLVERVVVVADQLVTVRAHPVVRPDVVVSVLMHPIAVVHGRAPVRRRFPL